MKRKNSFDNNQGILEDTSKKIKNSSENLSPENSSETTEKKQSNIATNEGDKLVKNSSESTEKKQSNISTNEDVNNIGTNEDVNNIGTNEVDKLAEAKGKSLNNIGTYTSDNDTTLEGAKELLGKLDKGTGQLSKQLTNIEEHLAEHNTWIDNACESSDGRFPIFTEDECQDIAKKAQNKAEDSASELVDSIKDVINNTTDLNDIALSPEVVDACNFISKFAEWLS